MIKRQSRHDGAKGRRSAEIWQWGKQTNSESFRQKKDHVAQQAAVAIAHGAPVLCDTCYARVRQAIFSLHLPNTEKVFFFLVFLQRNRTADSGTGRAWEPLCARPPHHTHALKCHRLALVPFASPQEWQSTSANKQTSQVFFSLSSASEHCLRTNARDYVNFNLCRTYGESMIFLW